MGSVAHAVDSICWGAAMDCGAVGALGAGPLPEAAASARWFSALRYSRNLCTDITHPACLCNPHGGSTDWVGGTSTEYEHT